MHTNTRSMRLLFGRLALLALAIASVGAAPPSYDGKVVLFGNLHAHSKLSDDIRNVGDEMLPIRAFEYAHAHGLDFLAISDHHKANDSTSNPLRMTQPEFRSQLYDVAMNYNAAHAGRFIAIPAIEWGNTATGNHVNVFGLAELPPDTIKGADYDDLFAWAKTHAEFVQFNHPYSWAGESNRDEDVGNFGEALYPDTTAFVNAVGPAVRTVSIISTVAGGHLTGAWAKSDKKTHRERNDKGWSHYLRFLNLGFHISPAANQDTHGTNWGTVTAARTAVWADTITYSGLMDAFKKNRVYATEDDEMAVVLRVKYKAKTHWMGETVTITGNEEDVELEMSAWQGIGSDGDSTDEGPYTFTIYLDSDGVGGQPASQLERIQHVAANQFLKRSIQVSPGQYVLIGVSEEKGKDNPLGDGDDEQNNSTGADGADGKRDDMNDSAWTSPIWFSHGSSDASPTFVWSKNSELYHDANCRSVDRIGQANRREGAQPPAGKRKHNCADN